MDTTLETAAAPRRFHPAAAGALLAVLAFSTGCQTHRSVAISSEPPGAMVQVDGQNVGTTPLNHDFDFDRTPRVIVGAILAGYHPEQVTLGDESPAVDEGHVNLVLMEDEAWKVTTTSEATNNWLRVQVDGTLAEKDVWQKLIDSVTLRFSNLEQLDSASGYVRTVTEVRRFRGTQGPYKVRTRFLCSMSSREPLVYKFKLEAEITDRYGDWIPYERVFREDAELIEELRNRLGVK